MKTSVIIPTKNAGKLFEKVLKAVLEQTTNWEYEVLVIDSGSTDGTVEYVKSVAGVRLHQIPSYEFGHGKTRNLGIFLTKGEFVVMLTHDAMPASSMWLTELVSAVEQSPDIAGSFGRHYSYEESGLLIHRDLMAHFDGFKNAQNIVWKEDSERYDIDQGYRQFLHFFSDNNACLRRTVWEKIPYPEVDFAEDQLWAKMIIDQGYKKAYADKAAVYHSHTYNLRETFRRSFDESRALKRLFGYVLCPSFFHGAYQVYTNTFVDTKYLISNLGFSKSFYRLMKLPFMHFMKQSGFFMGAYQGMFKDKLFVLFSLDGAKRRS